MCNLESQTDSLSINDILERKQMLSCACVRVYVLNGIYMYVICFLLLARCNIASVVPKY